MLLMTGRQREVLFGDEIALPVTFGSDLPDTLEQCPRPVPPFVRVIPQIKAVPRKIPRIRGHEKELRVLWPESLQALCKQGRKCPVRRPDRTKNAKLFTHACEPPS
jgi:hypothetical protein